MEKKLIHYLKMGMQKIFFKVMNFFSLHLKYNVSEIFVQQNMPDKYSMLPNRMGSYNRLDVIVRYLAIENYYGLNDYGFAFYDRMQKARIGKEGQALERFIPLIKSYAEKGYNDNSKIELDKGLHLMDGSHRLALALFHKQKNISCVVRPYVYNVDFGVSWFMQNGFSIEEINIILDKCKELIFENQKTISCILWPSVYSYFDQIEREIGYFYEIQSTNDFYFPSRATFGKAVKAVYSVDNIADWKVEKKIKGLEEYPTIFRILNISFCYPQFRRKKSGNLTISMEGEKLKRIIRERYKDRVDNYFYDIIIHTGDNYEQSAFINKVFEAHFSLKEYFEYISEYKWLVIKADELLFENEKVKMDYPFSKDIDIICSQESFKQFVKTTVQFAENRISSICDSKIIWKSMAHCQVRIELEGFLIFLFDIFCEMDYLRGDFLTSSLEKRIKKDNYYIPSEIDEIVYRLNEYIIHPEKKKHYEYILAHFQNWDSEYIKAAIQYREKDVVIEKINRDILDCKKNKVVS